MTGHWSKESLWSKTQAYVQQADEAERGSAMYAFWSHLALEFVVRTTLATVSPVLLAEHSQSRGAKSLLYALGRGDASDARSLGTAQLLETCRAAFSDFTKEDQAAALLMLDRRNRELHTGELAFVDLPLQAWQVDYFRIAQKLLAHQERTLDDLFGIEDAATARQMIEAAEQRIEKRVKDLIAATAKGWMSLSQAERLALGTAAQGRPRTEPLAGGATCPSCGGPVRIGGEQMAVGQTRLNADNQLTEDVRLLPTSLRCHACGLTLTGHAEMYAANLGSQLTISRYVDPVEFHGIDINEYIDPSEYIAVSDGPEYEDE